MKTLIIFTILEVPYNLFVFVINTSFISQFTTQNTLLQYAHFRFLVWWMKSMGLRVNHISMAEFLNCNVHTLFFLVVFSFWRKITVIIFIVMRFCPILIKWILLMFMCALFY